MSSNLIREVFFAEHVMWREQLRDKLCAVFRDASVTIDRAMSERIDDLVDRATADAFDPTNKFGFYND